MSGSLYLWVNAACLAFPLLLSFDRRVAFYKSWPAFSVATLVTLAVFIPWDVAFATRGIWGFNPNYLIGVDILHLPLEEWLFFISIPYACTFTFACFKAYGRGPMPARVARTILTIVHVFLWTVPLVHWWITGTFHAYTCSAFGFGIVLTGLCFMRKPWGTLGWFFRAFPALCVPFLIANGVLTGIHFWKYPVWNTRPEGISDMIVWYNNDHNLGVRLMSVPLDDFVYAFGLIGLNVLVYEWWSSRKRRSSIRE